MSRQQISRRPQPFAQTVAQTPTPIQAPTHLEASTRREAVANLVPAFLSDIGEQHVKKRPVCFAVFLPFTQNPDKRRAKARSQPLAKQHIRDSADFNNIVAARRKIDGRDLLQHVQRYASQRPTKSLVTGREGDVRRR